MRTRLLILFLMMFVLGTFIRVVSAEYAHDGRERTISGERNGLEWRMKPRYS